MWRFNFSMNIFQLLTIITCIHVVKSADDIQTIKLTNRPEPALATPSIIHKICGLTETDVSKCAVRITDLPSKFPLIIEPSTLEYIFPTEEGYLHFDFDQEVYLSCARRPENYFELIPDVVSQTFVCQCNELFSVDNLVYYFGNLNCTDYPQQNVRDVGHVGTNLLKQEVGFYPKANNHFLKIIDVYYDQSTATPAYVKFVVSKIPKSGRQCTKRVKDYFSAGGHLYSDIDSYYEKNRQLNSFSLQLRLPNEENARKAYIDVKSTTMILNRGHLTPKSSMIYATMAKATFVHVNVVPQWAGINSGNWGRIEEHVELMAICLEKDLIVITGRYRQLQLKGDDNTMKDMYLFAEQQGLQLVRRIPIPLYTYKIIIEPESKKGVVFVTLNNPFIDKIEGPTFEICNEPFYNRHQLLTAKQIDAKFPSQWKPNIDTSRGWSFMCYVDDFLRFTQIQLPDTDAYLVNDLLYLPPSAPHVRGNNNG